MLAMVWTGCNGDARLPPLTDSDSDSAPAVTDTGDTPDTGSTPACTTVTFTASDGRQDDLTQAFTAGDFLTLDEAGTLAFCPGIWFVRLTLAAPVTVLGLGETPEETVLSGGEAGTVLTATGEGVDVVVENATLDRGATDGVRNEQVAGGITCADGASVRVVDAVLSNHYAYDGAAIFALTGCALDLEAVRFVANEAQDDGGAVRVDTSTATLSDVHFEGGEARDCGGLFVHDSDVSIDGATFAANVSRDSQGGALLHYYGSLQIRDAVFASNQANGVGGALALFGDTLLDQVSFYGNAADSGGGAIYLYPEHGSLTCSGCSFGDNTPDDVGLEGGASYRFGADVDFTCDVDGCR
jgi:hypothetical protein